MLRRYSISQSEAIVDNVYSNGRSLVPVPGTPLNSLVNSLISLNETGSADQLFDQSINPGSTMGSHDEIEELAVKQIAFVMGNIINTAKNVVRPYSLTILENIEKERKLKALQAAALLGTIKQYEVPALLSDTMFQELIQPFKGSTVAVVENSGLLLDQVDSAYNAEERNELTKTGSAGLDAKALVFAMQDSGETKRSLISLQNLEVFKLSLQECVYLFLLFTGIQNEKNEKASAIMAESANKVIVAGIRASTGARIQREMEIVDMSIRNGDLVVSSKFLLGDIDEMTLPVYAVNYQRWIKEKGGSPEAALGFLAKYGSVSSYSSGKELEGNPKQFFDEYQTRLSHAQTIANIEDVLLVKKCVRDYLSGIIVQSDYDNKPILQQRLNQALEREYHGGKSVKEFVIKAVARTLTDGPAVKDLMLEIDNVLEGQDKPDMDYAVYLGCVRLIARWLGSQIQVQGI